MSFPVSVKGVLLDGADGAGRVVLLENDREEWELPGGRLEEGESLRGCLEREFYEELGARVEVGPLLGAEVFEVVEDRWVIVISYGCFGRDGDISGFRVSGEHQTFGEFEVERLREIELPEVYIRAVREWSERCGSS